MNGRGAASVSIYESLGEFYRGVEKNGSSLAGAPFWLVAAGVRRCSAAWSTRRLSRWPSASRHGVGWLAWIGVATTLLATAATIAPLQRNTG